jgi:rhodanese-related sulfurtransferase
MKNFKSLFLLFLSLFLLSVNSCKKNNSEDLGPFNKIPTAEKFNAFIVQYGGYEGAQILDIRRADYYAVGHIPGAKNITATATNTSSNDASFCKEVLEKFDKTKPILIYGAKNAVDLEYYVPGRVSKIGFEQRNTFVLLGGYESWKEKYPNEVEVSE